MVSVLQAVIAVVLILKVWLIKVCQTFVVSMASHPGMVACLSEVSYPAVVEV